MVSKNIVYASYTLDRCTVCMYSNSVPSDRVCSPLLETLVFVHIQAGEDKFINSGINAVHFLK